MRKRELPVERYLTKVVEAAGGRAIKLWPQFQVGLPDRLVLLPGGLVWFVELKAPDVDSLRPMQRVWRRALLRMGMNYAVLNTREKIDSWVYLTTI